MPQDDLTSKSSNLDIPELKQGTEAAGAAAFLLQHEPMSDRFGINDAPEAQALIEAEGCGRRPCIDLPEMTAGIFDYARDEQPTDAAAAPALSDVEMPDAADCRIVLIGIDAPAADADETGSAKAPRIISPGRLKRPVPFSHPSLNRLSIR
jgi:hypothetical protein